MRGPLEQAGSQRERGLDAADIYPLLLETDSFFLTRLPGDEQKVIL